MLTLLAVLGVLVVLFIAAVVATRHDEVLIDVLPDAADLDLPAGPVRAEDLATLRFSLAPRGYRMDQVDEVLDRLAAELADRDRRLAEMAAAPGPERPAPPERPAAPERPATPVAQRRSSPLSSFALPDIEPFGAAFEPDPMSEGQDDGQSSADPAYRRLQ